MKTVDGKEYKNQRGQTQPQRKVLDRRLKTSVAASGHGGYRDAPGQSYTPNEKNRVFPEDYLPLIAHFLPSKHELFLKVLKDDELWTNFRQTAAEAFCTGDKTYYLENNHMYPLCFAGLRDFSPYDLSLLDRLTPDHLYYSLSDLAVIAEKVVESFS